MQAPESLTSTRLAVAPLPIPGLSECFDLFEERFDERGVLGLLVLRFPGLTALEREYGGTARREVLERLGALVERAGRALRAV